jgi:hypothetical protein
MNYIKELNRFKDYLLLNKLSTGEIALYHALLQLCNMTMWQEWFTVPNPTVQSLTGLSRQGLDGLRNKLKQKNLIDYVAGSGSAGGKYKIIGFVCKIEDTTEDTIEDTTEDTIEDTTEDKVKTQNEFLLNNKKNKTKRKQKQNIYSHLLSSYTENKILKQALLDFIEMRKKIKAAPTENAFKLILNKLDTLADSDETKRKIIETSTMNNWKGIFPLKQDDSKDCRKMTDDEVMAAIEEGHAIAEKRKRGIYDE